MKVALKMNEELVITAESELEAFALRAWHGRYRNRKEAKLVMDIPEEFLDHTLITKWLDGVGRHLPDYYQWLSQHKPEELKKLPALAKSAV